MISQSKWQTLRCNLIQLFTFQNRGQVLACDMHEASAGFSSSPRDMGSKNSILRAQQWVVVGWGLH